MSLDEQSKKILVRWIKEDLQQGRTLEQVRSTCMVNDGEWQELMQAVSGDSCQGTTDDCGRPMN